MFAFVPICPGPVTRIVSEIPVESENYYSCGDVVEEGWFFDGVAFTPIEAGISTDAALKVDALNALKKSDITVIRCIESGNPIPERWKAYRNKLRDITSGRDSESDSLPEIPAFP